jgi:predicted transcriptional regulator
LVLTGRHLRAARGILGWKQTGLAQNAGVALGTIRRMEARDGPVVCNTVTLEKVETALRAAGISWANDGRPSVTWTPVATRARKA